jgi:hypothetical protein
MITLLENGSLAPSAQVDTKCVGILLLKLFDLAVSLYEVCD